jgi:hypothetical protein
MRKGVKGRGSLKLNQDKKTITENGRSDRREEMNTNTNTKGYRKAKRRPTFDVTCELRDRILFCKHNREVVVWWGVKAAWTSGRRDDEDEGG